MWDHAEHGIPPDIIGTDCFSDKIADLFKWSAVCETVIEHDDDLGFKTLGVREAGNKLAYKCLARLKLDLSTINPDEIFDQALLHAYPQADDHRLSTLEYALLAGFSHIGTVRNEIASKTDPLIVGG